jgi:hypothetical protein
MGWPQSLRLDAVENRPLIPVGNRSPAVGPEHDAILTKPPHSLIRIVRIRRIQSSSDEPFSLRCCKGISASLDSTTFTQSWEMYTWIRRQTRRLQNLGECVCCLSFSLTRMQAADSFLSWRQSVCTCRMVGGIWSSLWRDYIHEDSRHFISPPEHQSTHSELYLPNNPNTIH